MQDADFIPANKLEEALVEFLDGKIPQAEFLGTLANGQLYILLDKALPEGSQWDPGINLCVVSNEAGVALVAAFTSPGRAEALQAEATEFAHGLLVSTGWLLQGLGPDVGVAVNPGYGASVELSPRVAGQLRDAFAKEMTELAGGQG